MEDAGWEGRWLRFGMLQTSAPPPDPSADGNNDDDIGNWISSVVAAFATRLHGADFIREAQKEERL